MIVLLMIDIVVDTCFLLHDLFLTATPHQLGCRGSIFDHNAFSLLDCKRSDCGDCGAWLPG